MAEIEFVSDRRCCVCGRSDVQIHHLDDDPSNNNFENLALLCLTHHHEATIKSGIARKLSAATIRRYRNDHYQRVERRRGIQDVVRPQAKFNESFESRIQAVEVSEIRKIRAQLAFCNPEQAEPFLIKLYDYWQCGDLTKVAIFEAVYELAANTRNGLTHKLSFQIRNIVVNVLPLRNTWLKPSKQRLPSSEKAMYEIVIQIGFDMAYDAARYLNDLLIVRDGADLLWRVLRIAWKFRNRDLLDQVREEFGTSIEAAGSFPDAQKLLATFRDQATQQERGYPLLDDELQKAVQDLEAETNYPGNL